jgi:hypothetical protein
VAAVSAVGDSFARSARVIEVHVVEMQQLFNSMDPSPFHDRDLDPDAEEFIVTSARELPRNARLALIIHLDGNSTLVPEEAAIAHSAIQRFFHGRAAASRQRLRDLFRRGRISLAIGLIFLVTVFLASQMLGRWVAVSGFVSILQESLLIGGWVAMWRPIEIFLYDWWPIRADARLFERLANMPVSTAGM